MSEKTQFKTKLPLREEVHREAVQLLLTAKREILRRENEHFEKGLNGLLDSLRKNNIGTYITEGVALITFPLRRWDAKLHERLVRQKSGKSLFEGLNRHLFAALAIRELLNLLDVVFESNVDSIFRKMDEVQLAQL